MTKSFDSDLKILESKSSDSILGLNIFHTEDKS